MTARVEVMRRRQFREGLFASLMRRSSWGIADQALLSATNFVTMILLARVLSPGAFGAFALMYTTLLFANGFQSALVTQPHNVLGVSRRGVDYVRYTSSTAATQVVLCGATGTVILAAAAVASLVGWSASTLILALAPASVFWMAQEFVRRVLYTEGRIQAAFLNDLISYGGQTVAMIVLWRVGHLTAVTAIYALAATSALAVGAGVWQLRGSLQRTGTWADVLENWKFGKWLTGGLIAYWLSSQLYLYLSALILGTAATGILKAALVVMGPLNVLLIFIDTNVPIVLARALAAFGEGALRAQLKTVILWTAPIVGGYCLIAGTFSGHLLHFFFGSRYADHGLVLALFALNYFVLYLTRTVAAAVRAKRQTKYIFKGYLYSGLTTVSLGWLIIKLGGVNGAVLGMLLSSLVVFAVLLSGYLGGLHAVSLHGVHARAAGSMREADE